MHVYVCTVMHRSKFGSICPEMLILTGISELWHTNSCHIFLYTPLSWSFISILSLIVKQQWYYFYSENKSLGKVAFMNQSPKKIITLHKYTLGYLKFQKLKLKEKSSYSCALEGCSIAKCKSDCKQDSV